MHKALGLLVLTVALLGGCASEGSPGARAGAGDAGDAGSPKGGGADGDPASFPAACPTAEEIGAGLGQAMTLGHDGYANGDAELFCSYEPEAGGPPVAAHRVLHADVDLADRDFREANLGDGDDPRDPDAPDLSTARDLDLGDDAFLNTYAEPAAAGGGYDIRAQARVLVDVRMCNVDGVVSVSVPSPHLTPEAEDTVVGLLSALCGLGGGGPAAPPGTEPAAGAAPLPTQCPPVEEVGDLVGEPVRLSSESVTGGGDTLQCGYDGEGSVDSLFGRRFAQEDAYAAEFNFESRIT
ncbi:MAG TPA: hypothetical protein VFI47_02725, partial [Acidimicrobiales bacterium]|nr:hypothetical protein [Acidimicrobiales bacterium]